MNSLLVLIIQIIKHLHIIIELKLPLDYVVSVDWVWQTNDNCTIYLSLYVICIKYIPAIVIITLNIAMAWKLNGIWKLRRGIRENMGKTNVTKVAPRTSCIGGSPM